MHCACAYVTGRAFGVPYARARAVGRYLSTRYRSDLNGRTRCTYVFGDDITSTATHTTSTALSVANLFGNLGGME